MQNNEVFGIWIKHDHIKQSNFKILKRFKVHLSHKSNYTDIVDVALFVVKELENSGQLHGYWWMHQKCLGTQCSVCMTS